MGTRALLVVDNDPAVHELVSSVLKPDDCTVKTAHDGEEALAELRNAACELIVAGQGRNGLDGLTILRRAASIRPGARVIVTGEPDPVRIVSAIRGNAFSYFHKPLAPAPFGEMLQLALNATCWRDDIHVYSASPEWITLDLLCKLDAAERAVQFLREIESDLAPQKRDDVIVAFRELLLNAIEHGCKSDPRKRTRASFVRTSRSLIVHIQDPGSGFSLDLLPHAAISNPDDSPTRHVELRAQQGQRPGGFGILMTRNMVDDLVYNERGNAVLFVKYL